MASAEVEQWRANRMTRRSLFRAVPLWPAHADLENFIWNQAAVDAALSNAC